jgi:hypothetical protein
VSVRGNFRVALQADLQTAFGFAFVGGPLGDGPIDDRTVGAVWWERKRPFGRDGNREENVYLVRVYRQWKQPDSGVANMEAQYVAPLEALAEQLEAELRAVLTTIGHDFFNVAEVSVDYPGQYVEAQLVAYDQNRSARGG